MSETTAPVTIYDAGSYGGAGMNRYGEVVLGPPPP